MGTDRVIINRIRRYKLNNKKMKMSSMTLAVITLVGCATSESIMASYKGKDVIEVTLDYGQPSNIIKTSDTKRIYQWEKKIKRHVPKSSYSHGAVSSNTNAQAGINASTQYYGGTANIYGTVSGHSNTQASGNLMTQEYGGYTKTNDCIYNLYAEKDLATGAWMVTGYRPPIAGC